MGVQRMHLRGPFLDDSDARVTVAVNPPLMPLGDAKPPPQVQVVLHRRELASASEQAGAEARHQVGQMLSNGARVTFETTQDRIQGQRQLTC